MLGHPHVGQDDVGVEGVEQRERRLAAVGHLDLVAVLLEQRAQDEADVLFVVDDQDPAHGAKSLHGHTYLQNEAMTSARQSRARNLCVTRCGGSSGCACEASMGSGVRTGLDRLATHADARGRAARPRGWGSLAHAASVDRRLVHARDILDALGVRAARRASAPSTATAARRRT